MKKNNVIPAFFDIKPVNQAGEVDFHLITNLKPIINLKSKIVPKEEADYRVLPIKTKIKKNFEKEENLKKLKFILSQDINLKKELKKFGGLILEPYLEQKTASPASKREVSKKQEEEEIENFRKEILKLEIDSQTKIPDQNFKFLAPLEDLPWVKEGEIFAKQKLPDFSLAGKEIEAVLANFKKEIKKDNRKKEEVKKPKGKKLKSFIVLGIIAFFIFSGVKFLNFKNRIIKESEIIYSNLNEVKASSLKLNPQKLNSFFLAKKNFELISDDLKKIYLFLAFLDDITFGSVSEFSNLLKAGKLISQASGDISFAFRELTKINLISTIQGGGRQNVLDILRKFRFNLIQGSRNLNQAEILLQEENLNLIPESEKGKFLKFKSALPEINNFIEKTISYSDFLMEILGQSERKRYLVLFQNSSELRATGGFPGTYGLIEFEKGKMEKFFVENIYAPDGQMKEKIIPPKQLQKITSNWGMRDANWFPNFPTSAKKIAEFYYKETGNLVDGVITFNVDLMPEILKIVGPINMPDYHLTIDADNFLVKVQEEVEYLKTKGEPKQILIDFAPKLFEKLANLNQEDWFKIFSLLIESIERKDILAYFADSKLEEFAKENNFAGEIRNDNSQFLMIVHSNIMGSKTDAVIENFVSLDIEIDQNRDAIYNLEIKRSHKGGDTDYGFYNKRNNDYIRVLVPQDSELLTIEGNDQFQFKPALDYENQGFISDPDLKRYEEKFKKFGDIDIFEEEGKKGFGFWLITNPKETKKVLIKYKTSLNKENHSLFIQKQPGAKQNLKVRINGKLIFDGKLDRDLSLEFRS